ncbi:MAG TPA: CHASE2 domain-containing protein [Verrucomicrobiae bacterium]|jgi:adenylate cyclase|nr:CHASE2 domain-containing protein [Verrucomicrobiae bacterium]
MEELKARIKKNWRGAAIGAICAAMVGWLLMTTAGDRLTHWSYDLPFAVRGAIPATNAVMVYLDEESHTALGQPYGAPWDRSLHAKLLRRITAQHPKGVVFDIVFSDPGENTNADNDLAAAIKESGKVILATDSKYHEDEKTTQYYPPFDLLYNACDARCGTTDFYPDSDLVTRLHLPARKIDDLYGSEAWEAAKLADAPITHIDSAKTHRFNINYYGPSDTIPWISFYKVVSDEIPISTNFFRNKMVFVGAHITTVFSGQRKDAYPTPFSFWHKDTFSSGVEIEATSYLNLLRHDFLNRISPPSEYATIVLFGLVSGFILALLRPLMAVFVALVLAAISFVVDYVLFIHFHLWFAWVIIALAQLPVALTCSVVFNSVQLYVERRLFEQTLGLYLSHKLVKKFANDPKLRLPGAEKQLLTILFTDIASFTTISEGMEGNDLARLMNQYFQGAVQNCIFPMEGTVVKYIGDAIFAFWNAPEPQADHAYRACEAALRLRQQDKFSANGHPLLTRLGLHTGEANVGNFGSDARFDYTALGENINLAARMEGLNKYLGTRVLITSDTKNAIDGRLVARYLGLFRLKGFEKAVGVYELMARADEESESAELRARFAAALEKFCARDFAGAEIAFQRVLEISPEDGPSQFYLEHINELVGTELPPAWKGDITLKDK